MHRLPRSTYPLDQGVPTGRQRNASLLRQLAPRLTIDSLRPTGRLLAIFSVSVILVFIWLGIETGLFGELSRVVSEHSPLLLIIEYARNLLGSMGYAGLVAVIFIENVFPPIPSDVLLPLAGFTAATTSMTLLGAILATTAGSLLGAITLYYLGYWLGEARVRKFAGRFGKYLTFEEAEVDRSLAWFRKHGSIVVMVARVVPVFRSLISIPAGMSGMPLGRFLVFTAIGAGAWNSGLISTGYFLGANWELVVGWLDQYQLAMMTLNAGVFLGLAFFRVRSYRRRRAALRAVDPA
jgi:membrane protein DedA with SNARE-associated domain